MYQSSLMAGLRELGQRLGSNSFVAALRAAMMQAMGLILVGAASQALAMLGSGAFGLFQANSQAYNVVIAPYNFTVNLLGLWMAVLVGYDYARELRLRTPLLSAVEATACFLLVAGAFELTEAGVLRYPITYLGASGMFVAFLVALVCCQVDRVCADNRFVLALDRAVPEALREGFASFVPFLANAVLFVLLDVAVSAATGGVYGVCSGFLALLSLPLGLMTSLPGVFVACTLGGVLWCAGINGTAVLSLVFMPLIVQAATANADAFASGGVQALTFYPVTLFAAMAACGGTGNTLPAAVFGAVLAKSKRMRAVGRAALVPAWCNMSEPVVFGMPVISTPLLWVPYVLSIPVNMLFFYIGYSTGLLVPAYISVSAILPMGFAQYFSTLNVWNAAWDYLSFIPMALVWLPFLLVYDRQLCEEEQGGATGAAGRRARTGRVAFGGAAASDEAAGADERGASWGVADGGTGAAGAAGAVETAWDLMGAGAAGSEDAGDSDDDEAGRTALMSLDSFDFAARDVEGEGAADAEAAEPAEPAPKPVPGTPVAGSVKLKSVAAKPAAVKAPAMEPKAKEPQTQPAAAVAKPAQAQPKIKVKAVRPSAKAK